MKQQQWMMALCCMFALWGCKPTDNTIQVGTYEGVVWSDDTLPLSAQVVVQNSATLLTLWDEREHQTSYLGSSSDDQLVFSAVGLSCEMSAAALTCTNSNGETTLSPVSAESLNIASFAGTYQARYNDALLQMNIDDSGALTVSGASCESSGSLTATTEVNGLADMQLADDQCAAAGHVNLVTLETENESLVSLNIQTNSETFPQVWVKI
ncbi:hypothetical protein KW508_03750 [Vibrio fluvialis]|uniref:hypothetical protein n=1 Tax=Vibrio fluvialis TaxID=676 RepID=UPI00192BC42E|nr:hypothetical protein [Vibrio fluvialis]MBL4282435.1 hypothetical protein [Vibrio fluvialis]MBY8157127.1 hypothetical protein [Vibrio fluvialis]